MDHVVTVGMIVWPVLALLGIFAVLGGVAWFLSSLDFSH